MNKKEIGIEFEKEAFMILKKYFKKVIWLSKKNKSLFDFKCLDRNDIWRTVEAKRTTTQNRIALKLEQQGADYVIFKNKKGEIRLIEKKDFNRFLILEKERVIENRPEWMLGKRIRRIVKYGNNFGIKLDRADLKDFELKEGDVVDIDDLCLLEVKEK